MIRIVQRHPRLKSKKTYGHPLAKNRSPTDSLESFQNRASKNVQILQRNCRVPQYEIVLHFLIVFSPEKLKKMLKRVFGYLRKAGLSACADLEPTDDGFDNPTDTVHSHILTDDDRGEDFLRELVRTACLAAGLQDKAVSGASRNEFDVECRSLNNGDDYYYYTEKLGYDTHLFVTGTNIRRSFTIGNWFIDADGNPTTKKAIWDKIIQETRERNRAKSEAQFYEEEMGIYMTVEVSDEEIETHASYMRNEGRLYDEEYTEEWMLEDAGIVVDEDVEAELSSHNYRLQPPNKSRESMRPNHPQSVTINLVVPPADVVPKLQKIVSNETDLMLQDWQRVLHGESPMFHTNLPDWIYRLPDHKRQYLLWAIDLRLRPIDFNGLKQTLDRYDDQMWYDAYSLLQGKPMVFHAKLLDRLDWLGWHLKHGQKRQDLLDAIEARLLNTKNQRISILLEQFHGLPRKKQESQRIAWQRIR